MYFADTPVLADLGEDQQRKYPQLHTWPMCTDSTFGISVFMMCLRRLLGPIWYAVLNTAPPTGMRSTMGPLVLALTIVLLLGFTRNTAAIVRTYCYLLLLSNVLATPVTHSGTGPLIAAPPFFDTLPAAVGKSVVQSVRTSRGCPRTSASRRRLLGAGPRRMARRSKFVGAVPRLGGSLLAMQMAAAAPQFGGLDSGLGRGRTHYAFVRLRAATIMRHPVCSLVEAPSFRVPRRGFLDSMPYELLAVRGLANLPPSAALLRRRCRVTRLHSSREVEVATRALDKAARPSCRSSFRYKGDDVKGQVKSQKCTSCTEFKLPHFAFMVPRKKKRSGTGTTLPAEECWGALLTPLATARGLPRPSPLPPPQRPNTRPGIVLCNASSSGLAAGRL